MQANVDLQAPKKPARRFSIQVVILMIFTPIIVLMVGMFAFFYSEFRDVAQTSEQITDEIVPQILNTQRVFINIDSLRYHFANIHETAEPGSAHNSLVDAQAILVEIQNASPLVSASGNSEMMRQLQIFWYRRLKLDGMMNKINDELAVVRYHGTVILNALGEDMGEHDTIVGWSRQLSVTRRMLDYRSPDAISKVRQALRKVITVCNGEQSDPEVKKHCKLYMDGYDVLRREFESFRRAQVEFDIVYDSCLDRVNNLVVQSSQQENLSISDSIEKIKQVARSTEPVVFILLFGLLALMVFSYLLLYRLISYPLGLITRVINIFRSGIHRPRNYPTSRITEIESINQVLPKLFEELQRSQTEAFLSNKNYMKLLDVSMKDELTGVLNRRALDNFIAKNSLVPMGMCVLMVDIDHFKNFNDVRGHQYGDYILKTIATTLMNSLSEKSNDRVFRFGGEEFVVIVQNIDEHMRLPIGERLCERVRALNIPNSANDTGLLTISVGCSVVESSEENVSIPAMISQADVALYEAKRLGRNRVVLTQSKSDKAKEAAEAKKKAAAPAANMKKTAPKAIFKNVSKPAAQGQAVKKPAGAAPAVKSVAAKPAVKPAAVKSAVKPAAKTTPKAAAPAPKSAAKPAAAPAQAQAPKPQQS